MSQSTGIAFTQVGSLAYITLDRPEKLNVWNSEMEEELHRLMQVCAHDDNVRAIVLTGAGHAFCAGVDVDALKAASQGVKADRVRPPGTADFDQRYSYLLAIPKPIICGINGPAAGVGLVLALYCDIRYVSKSAKLAAVFARRGLVAEHGIAWLLPRLIGLSRTMEWLLSGRTMLAEEAVQIGLANAVFSDHTFKEDLDRYASELATKVSPRSTGIIKRQLYEGCMHSLRTSVEVADAEIAGCLETADFKEGVMHFIEKRQPNFTGR